MIRVIRHIYHDGVSIDIPFIGYNEEDIDYQVSELDDYERDMNDGVLPYTSIVIEEE